MLLSMTGFGKAVAENETKKFTVELKSLNSKQMDLASRVPSAYREMELEMRNAVTAALERGKADLTLYCESLAGTTDVNVNIDRLKTYKAQIETMAVELGIDRPEDWYGVLLRFPDAFHSDAPAELTEDDRRAVGKAVADAIARLVDYRAAEGKKLESFFAVRIDRIRQLLAMVPRYEQERIVKIRGRIMEALEKIPQADYDRGRFEQEMIFYIEKLDINEEKQRLTQHLDYFLETMEAKPGQGKKLGFIAQEMGREINTLGSKSNHAEMQILVVKMKDELEQIKEQVLNVL